MPTARTKSRVAICLANEGYEDLQLRKVYRILPDPKGAEVACLRVVDDSGEDYLYPADRFVVVEVSKAVQRRLFAPAGRAV